MADRAVARVAVFEILMESQPWEGFAERPQRRSWKLLTLTTPAPTDLGERWDPETLAKAVNRALVAWGRFWRRTSWGRQIRDPDHGRKRARRDTAAIRALEIAPGGMVHIHLAVYGEYIRQAELQSAWEKALRVERAIVHIRAAGDDLEGLLRETLKYAVKGEGPLERRAHQAAAVEMALYHRRRVEYIGAIRKVTVAEAEGSEDDTRPEDLHDHHRAACEVCGSVGRWRWCAEVSAGLVDLNGGYGLYVTSDPGGPRGPP